MLLGIYNAIQATANLYLMLRCGIAISPHPVSMLSLQTSVIRIEGLQALDVLLSALHVLRSNTIVTAIQTIAKLVVVYFGQSNYIHYLGLVWAMSDFVRYTYHLMPNVWLIRFARYRQYRILYPIGIGLELLTLLPAVSSYSVKLFIVFLYFSIFPHMYNHASKLETNQHILDLINRYRSPPDADISSSSEIDLIYGKSRYRFGTPPMLLLSTKLSDPRYCWKPHYNEQNTFILKDYGLQISWRLVYVVEYIGALLFFPLLVGDPLRPDSVMWGLHFSKRVIESIFVHSFSSKTMPFTNLFKNCSYYWGAAVLLGYYAKQEPIQVNEIDNVFIIILWTLCQIGNGFCHLYLAGLRCDSDRRTDDSRLVASSVVASSVVASSVVESRVFDQRTGDQPTGGKKEHMLPTNILFRIITCPNYTYEIVGWTLFACLGYRGLSAYFSCKLLFCLIGAVQMYKWANEKKRRYKNLFGDKYKVTGVLLPGL